MSYPKTADEWWALCELHKSELSSLVRVFHPTYGRQFDARITAPAAEVARQSTVSSMPMRELDPTAEFDAGVTNRSFTVPALLSETWFGVPESLDAHSLPGFGTLCDLCSESYLLFPEDEDDA